MADSRREMDRVAKAAAHEAVTPLRRDHAVAASRQEFVRMAQLRDTDGQPLVDPKALAEEWAQLDPALTASPAGAEVVLERVMGRSMRQGKRPAREPIFSEPAGGHGPSPRAATQLERRLGLSDQDVKSSAGRFNPTGISVIGED